MTDDDWMRSAIAEGESAYGTTAPNPSVGAVVVRDGVVLGSGRTQPVGHAHAEVDAIRAAREAGHSCEGATLYVTLEPCGHHGRTPPCTDAILEAGIRRVVVGVLDPTKPMQGRSLELLAERGVEVVLGTEAVGCRNSLLGWLRSVEHGLPWVTLKLATTLDGRVATASGESKWITGEQARLDGRGLRGRHDAILVGVGTVIADDPRLTTRIDGRPDPVAVIVDTHLRTPCGCQLDQASTIIYTGPDSTSAALSARAMQVPLHEGRVDLEAVLRDLAASGRHRVLIEGGAEVAGSAIRAGLVDEIVQYVAGVTLPGGRHAIGGPTVQPLADAVRMSLKGVDRVGGDVRLIWSAPHRLEAPCSQG